MTPTLVLLAAGLGRRFGGLKQLAPVGPGDAAIVDHAVVDAAAAGFGQVVVIVRREIHDEVHDHIARRAPLPVVAVCQDDIGPARTRPWGTAHALLALDGVVDGPFAVANADDHYGADAWELMGHWLRRQCARGRAALMGYRASATLSPSGPVSRAVCEIDGDGHLLGVVEHVALERDPHGGLRSERGPVDDDPLISMNLWGLHPSFLADVRRAFDAFVVQHGTSDDAELRIPDVVDDLLASREIVVDVLGPAQCWIGITYPEDLPAARAAFSADRSG